MRINDSARPTRAARPLQTEPVSAAPPPLPSVARFVFEQLKREGVGAAFGIPGGPVTPLFDALHGDTQLRIIGARHEAGAAFMACGYARLGARPGVCVLTTGPGTTNAVTGIAAAKADSLPVLALTAQVPGAAFGKGSLQDSTYDRADTVAMLRPVTKLSAMVTHPEAAGTMLRQALRVALSGRPGPVHLNLPTDLMRRTTAQPLQRPSEYRCDSRVFDREAVKRAAALLLAAERPAILAGHGINLAGARAELLELAELLSIPVATTPKGKGAFPEEHPLALRVFGLASSPRAEGWLLGGVDTLLVLGSGLHENSTQGWEERLKPSRALIQQDIDPANIGRNYPVTQALVGDARVTLRELIFELKRRLRIGEHPCCGDPGAFHQWKEGAPAVLAPRSLGSAAVPLKPQRVMAELDEALPEDAAVFIDVGNHTLWALHYLTATGKNDFVHNWGEFAAMGYGLAGSIGGKLAAPHRAVVAVAGDGGFAMAGMEISTAVTHGVPVVWVIFNDARLNAVYHGQRLQYQGRTTAAEFARMDVAAVAKALGAWSQRVERPGELAAGLREALGTGRPAVLDVWIDAEEVPPIQSRIKSLDKLFAGFAAGAG